jgi:putative DNA primase/helicase
MDIYPNQIALDYLTEGFSPIPVGYRSKEPKIKGWPQLRISANNIGDYFNGEPTNIGVLTGTPSGGLVDVDIDSPDALKFAPHFLPQTNCIFGRLSNPQSHWLYRVDDLGSCERFVGDTTVIELRGQKHYTLFPGSIHPGGERIEFAYPKDHTPSVSSWIELTKSATKIAIATELRKRWAPGIRHQLTLSVSALLARQNWIVGDVVHLIKAVATEAGDDELSDRINCVQTTFQRYARNEAISGDERLDALLGQSSAESIRHWSLVKSRQVVPVNDSLHHVADLSTDATAADSFAEAFKGEIIFCNGHWYRQRNQVFEPTSDVIVQGLAKQFFQNEVEKSSSGPLALSHFRSCLNRTRINAAVELSRAHFNVPTDEIDSKPDLVGCSDGHVLNLGTDGQHSTPAGIITKKLGASQNPGASCPTWMNFLSRIFNNDQGTMDFVRRAVGYSLTGSVAEQCMFILIGTGANGKSTFLRTLHHLFGDYAGSVPIQTLMTQKNGSQQTNDLAYLLGKRFVTASEGERDQRLAEAKIKMMTGGDRISCRFMYADFFEFDPQFKLWLATNNLPSISGTDDAIWRRIRVIHFPITIPPDEQDKTLLDQLLEELAGILTWALEGLKEWRQQGLNPPPSVVHSTKRYREDNDSVGQWIEAACMLEPGVRTAVKDLHEAYKTWCGNSGLDPLTNACFGKELSRLGFEIVRLRSGNARRGIALKQE